MSYTIIRLRGILKETDAIFTSLPITETEHTCYLSNIFLLVENIINDKSITDVIIQCEEDFTCLAGQVEQLFNLFKRITVHGKTTYFFSKTYDEKALYLAASCKKRLIAPTGTVAFLGFKKQFTFVKRLLDKYEIEADIIRRGKYKGAADIYRLDRIDDAQKEAYSAIIEATYETFIKTITASFDIDRKKFEEEILGNFVTPEKAKLEKLVTDIGYIEDLILGFEKEKKKKHVFKKIPPYFGKGKRVAVLVFDGGIKDGSNQKDFLMGNKIGDNYFVKQIDRLRKNKKIKSVILKVNSPGGSASASDTIAFSLLKLKEKKDLVVVQSAIAGSGGYYISFPGEKIFTQNTTITGSIGVISLFLYIDRLYQRFGITHSVLKKGENADIFSPLIKRSQSQLKLIEDEVDRIYKGFVENVAKNRALTVEQVDEIAEGRVWSGLDAVKIKIADEIGDLHSAIDYLKEKYKTKNFKVEFFPKKKVSWLSRLLLSRKSEYIDIDDEENEGGSISSLKDRLSYFEKVLKNLKSLESGKPLLLMPEIFIENFLL
ncbi:MAG: signal peptide peptidase SppA [Spirochaetes bacterium]|nr:signal peptide peptidase SppA [Spirochaetota bacterium]